ncbi:hypothetical protein AGR13a_Cc170333 [Agrobacterium genomosp. 13 str. CFBP 6927]|uniref:Secreted protein n=1 Tax=Agrobacterium genomosp. 13 str. CFBP 6927 TaxID=1183428 RepID=A0ABM9VC78_9HYPH|nr:hypothetical protein AGR13a_Cc170333 [Agrobacterium genomosp. 13 str. CFBP 6927]
MNAIAARVRLRLLWCVSRTGTCRQRRRHGTCAFAGKADFGVQSTAAFARDGVVDKTTAGWSDHFGSKKNLKIED